jgi:predicted phage-related endonuclease
MNGHFPDCKILMMRQRSYQWHQARKGVLTASNFGAWILKDSDQRSREAREKAICKLIAERANCEEAPNYENWAMTRGAELEPKAVAAFMGETGKKVREVGFCRSIYGAFGCSPDGLIEGENAGLEGKVPIPPTHIAYRRAGALPDEYIYQVHGSMAVTGADRWFFQSWCPGLAPLRITVERSDLTDKLKAALILFSMQFEEAWAQERAAVAAMGGGGDDIHRHR